MFTSTAPPAASEQTAKERINSKIAAAERALADVMSTISGAVADGDIPPCTCHYSRIGCAQDDLERLRQDINGENDKKGMPPEIASMLETMLRR